MIEISLLRGSVIPARVDPDLRNKISRLLLLSAVLERQLGGRIVREWGREGLCLLVGLPSLDRVGQGLKSNP
ncbi:hypothetical protein EXN51_15040 [Agrobacterium fabrum]|uniref:Uncharacterized protein n=1 Tax=Agrobacterium fabrum (strain C58 / ATCC 33970) TaxID=176299 RepID=Q8UK29_AGRFC|nr:hypothetical protein Atu5294 [Agrobacterium fabrum str. C58]TRB28321.1 hypothetical protein EXN51_15040 [Agrobacterium fabrum]